MSGTKRAVATWDQKRGVWYAQPYLGRNKITGKQIRPYKQFPEAHNQQEAQEMADAWFAEEWGAFVGLGLSRSISDCLDNYLATNPNHLAEQTINTYKSSKKRHVDHLIGSIAVDDLKPYQVTEWQHVMADAGYSVASIAKTHHFLSAAWDNFMANGLTDTNPWLVIKPPTPAVKETAVYSVEDMAILLPELTRLMAKEGTDEETVRNRTCAFGAYLALHTGARCGEVCALMATDIDLRPGRRSVIIRHSVTEAGRKPRLTSTKNKKERVVSIDDDAVVDQVKRHLSWRREVLATLGISLERGVPVLTLDGRLLRPSALSKWFSGLRDDLGLDKSTHFHTLRHTHATWLLEANVPIRVVQERLGHAEVATTLRIYGHVLPGSDAVAAQAFARAIGDGVQ